MLSSEQIALNDWLETLYSTSLLNLQVKLCSLFARSKWAPYNYIYIYVFKFLRI